MARNRELSQIASLILVDDSTSNIAISTNFSFVGIGSVTPKTNLDVVGNARFTGIVTATKFVGDGSQLTNLPAIAGGGGGGQIFIQEEGSQVGGALTTINIVGPRITAINSGVGIATISVDIDYFPVSDYGDLSSPTTDAFGVALSYAFDCLTQPQYSVATVDLQVLT